MPLERLRWCFILLLVGHHLQLGPSWFDIQLWYILLSASSPSEESWLHLSWAGSFLYLCSSLLPWLSLFQPAICSLILANQTALVLIVHGWTHNDVLYFVLLSFPMNPTVICFFGCQNKSVLLLHYLKFVSVLMVTVNRGLKGDKKTNPHFSIAWKIDSRHLLFVFTVNCIFHFF